MEVPKQYTLFELNEYIRRVLALNLAEAVWISCEIAQLNESKGHFYFSLVQKSEDGAETLARAEAVLWASDYRRMKRKLRSQLDGLLVEGLELMIQVRVDFHERYGLKLQVQDIDPVYTIGKLVLRRRQTIEQLRTEGLLELNSALSIPPVIQRVAVLSSARAAGYLDYLQHIRENPYGYRIKSDLFPMAMQGDMVEKELLAQLKKIANYTADYDVIILIRGGGARLDLQAFDALEIGRAIAESPLPVLTGIGHDIDETVADLAAHAALKTPTAVADFIIQHNLHFESYLLECSHLIQQISQEQINTEQIDLERLVRSLRLSSEALVRQEKSSLTYWEKDLPRWAKHRIDQEKRQLLHFEKMGALLDPQAILRRGFAQVIRAGKTITTAAALQKDDSLEIRFQDGTVSGKVTKENG